MSVSVSVSVFVSVSGSVFLCVFLYVCFSQYFLFRDGWSDVVVKEGEGWRNEVMRRWKDEKVEK